MSTVSAAVPVVAAAAAVLIDLARQINAPDNNDVIKAVLMAGADRRTDNGTGAEIEDYRVTPENRTDNGLDRRYGAGQVNIANSYAIIAAGQHHVSAACAASLHVRTCSRRTGELRSLETAKQKC